MASSSASVAAASGGSCTRYTARAWRPARNWATASLAASMNSSTRLCEGLSRRCSAATSSPRASKRYSGSNEPICRAPRAKRAARSLPASSAASSRCPLSASSRGAGSSRRAGSPPGGAVAPPAGRREAGRHPAGEHAVDEAVRQAVVAGDGRAVEGDRRAPALGVEGELDRDRLAPLSLDQAADARRQLGRQHGLGPQRQVEAGGASPRLGVDRRRRARRRTTRRRCAPRPGRRRPRRAPRWRRRSRARCRGRS